MYGVAVLSLIAVLIDGIVMWYEGLALVLTYIFYIVGKSNGRREIDEILTPIFAALAMCCNDIISTKARTVVARVNERSRKVRPFREVTEIAPLLRKNEKSYSAGSSAAAAAAEVDAGNGMYPSLDRIISENGGQPIDFFFGNSIASQLYQTTCMVQ